MVRKVKPLVAVLMALFLVQAPLYALVFDIDMATEAVIPAVPGGGTAQFNVKIMNNENRAVGYVIEITGPYMSWMQNYDYFGDIPANFTKIVPIKVAPSLETPPGDYQYSVRGTVKIGGKDYNLPGTSFTVKVLKSGEKFIGAATIELYTDKESYDPGAKARVAVRITKLTLAPEGLQIDLRLLDSRNNPVYEYLFPLSAQAEPIVFMQDVPMDPRMPPGDYLAVADLKSESGVVGTVRKAISVSTVNNPGQARTADVSALGKKVTIKIKNGGNVPVSGEIKEPMKWYEKFLLTANPKPNLERGSDGHYWIVWRYDNVMPGDFTRTYTYSISYVPVVLALLLVMLLAVAAWQSVRMISITKEVIRQKVSPTTLEASISLHVKNLSDRTILDVVLVDCLPGMARPTEFGTAKPADVKKEGDRTVMEWTLGELKPREERVITYRLHTAFGVVGLITLPAAVVRFTASEGGRRKHLSSGTVECGVVAQQ